MKKILKVFFAVALLLQLIPVFNVSALSGTNKDTEGKITIDNAVVGKTYTIYQILKLESFTKDEAYAYTVNTGWEAFVEGDGSDYLEVSPLGYVTWKGENTDARVREFAKLALEYANKNGIAAAKDPIKATSTTVVFDKLNLGYYVVDSSLGSVCSIDTTDNETTIKEKNSVPTVDKKVEENGTFEKTNDANIGDVVNFETTITVGSGSQDYVLRDTMSEGLTFDESSVKVTAKKKDGTAVETKDLYTINEKKKESDTFTVEFSNELTESVGLDGTIVVTYSATLNEKAVIAGNGNANNTSLDYGNNHNTTSTPTITYTYRFDLVKTKKSNEVLDGAEFDLYDSKNNQVKVVFVKKENGVNVYRVTRDAQVTSVKIEAGIARIEGLDSDTYTLKETKIPAGYNKLGEDPTITLNKANNDATIETDLYIEGGLQVINYTGSELPSTGGMGTTMFITIGSLMVMAFGTLLITKLRMAKENN